MHKDTSGLSRSLGVSEYGHLASAGRAGVRAKLKSEFPRIFCLNTVCDRCGMLVVASPTAVLDQDEV